MRVQISNKDRVFKKDYISIASIFNCDNNRYLKSIIDDLVLHVMRI